MCFCPGLWLAVLCSRPVGASIPEGSQPLGCLLVGCYDRYTDAGLNLVIDIHLDRKIDAWDFNVLGFCNSHNIGVKS